MAKKNQFGIEFFYDWIYLMINFIRITSWIITLGGSIEKEIIISCQVNEFT
jgi:hypothetical protein